jgi:trehalose-phosphatase
MTREIDPLQLNGILSERLGDRRLVFFLDYDGTLTSIVERPDLAVMDDDMRRTLKRLVKRHPVYVLSGRDMEDVRRRVGVEGVEFVGSHGFHLMESLPELDPEALDEAVAELDAAADEIEQWLDYIEGVLIERKTYSFALHYRMVDRHDLQQITSAAEDVLERYGAVTSKKGKKVIEFVPDIPWDKGCCIQVLLSRLNESGGAESYYPVCIGDDITDEDAFRVVTPETGLSILVAEDSRDSAAEFRLPAPEAVRAFLDRIG